MTGAHTEIPLELRQLAQAILDRLDPAVRAAAALTPGRGDSPGKCQQVWCPVCALAALAQGEQHPMLDMIAEHSVALLTVVRALVDADADADATLPPPESDGPAPPEPPSSNGYQKIPINIDHQ